MKILTVTLYRKWFYQILFGDKKIEYRQITKYWNNRLTKHYDAVLFINGYGKHRPRLLCEISFINKTDKYYEIYLGRIISTENIPNDINYQQIIKEAQ